MILFLLTMSLFFLELLLINHKYHFLTILCALALVAIFGLNYFDEMYIRLVMILLGLSLLLDFIWLFVRAGVSLCVNVESLVAWEFQRTDRTQPNMVPIRRTADSCRDGHQSADQSDSVYVQKQ